jgi:hypothetical protein
MAMDPPCSIQQEALVSVTRFLHDSCVIRYFGNLENFEYAGATDSTVYISTTWMMDVIKGLMRHDRQALTDFFIKERNKRMLRHINRLVRYGLLHEDLVPFLWPEQEESSAFWTFVREKGNREADVWSNKIVSTKHEGHIALTLLKEFNLIGEDRGTHFAPGVLPPALLPCPPVLYVKECPFNVTFVYATLPAGAFHSIVTSISKQNRMSVETGSAYAVIHSDSRGIAQLFCLQVQQRRNSCAHYLCFLPRQTFELSDQLIVRSSNEELLEIIQQQVLTMETKYAGLVRISESSKTFKSDPDNPPSLVWMDPRHITVASGPVCNNNSIT